MARVTCYDGVETIGGNKILLEDGKTKLWLDFGLNYSRWGEFYEEYLKPKNCLGLYEPIQMGLLPPFQDLYRPDLVSSLADPWVGKREMTVGDIAGVLISHAHMDHLGALHYVREDIPIYGSAMTLAIAKAVQDTGKGSPDNYCYVVPNTRMATGELTTRNAALSRPRPFTLAGEKPSSQLLGFWNTTPGCLSDRGRKHEQGAIGMSSVCGGVKIRRFPVDHSVYGASAWAIQTSGGPVVYTGDLRCHGRQADTTWCFAEEAAKLKPRILIIEGTRIDSDSTSTEDGIRDRALEEVKKAKGLVVADFGPRNIERLITFLEIARHAGRKLLLMPKDAYLLEGMCLAVQGGEIPSPQDRDIRIYAEFEATSDKWKDKLKERYADQLITPQEVAANQADFICCFSFWDINELAYIRPSAGSIWIYSSCEPFNEEMKVDFKRLRAWVNEHGMVYLGGDDEDKNNPFHVSGHACKSDLLKLVDMIQPQTVIPVHTEHPEIYAEELKGKCEVILPERGGPIEL